MKRLLALAASHALFAVAGFAAGIYMLPILIAPDSPGVEAVQSAASNSQFTAEFRRELEDSDALHWGEGTVSVGPSFISLQGAIAPGPDYKLYLSPQFVQTEAEFERLKPTMARVGDVKTFDNFVVAVPPAIDPAAYNTVIIWCEAFGEFITAAQYQ